jgi:hypothetical protein
VLHLGLPGLSLPLRARLPGPGPYGPGDAVGVTHPQGLGPQADPDRGALRQVGGGHRAERRAGPAPGDPGLYRRPESLFAARFLADAAEIPTRIAGGRAGTPLGAGQGQARQAEMEHARRPQEGAAQDLGGQAVPRRPDPQGLGPQADPPSG